MKFKKWQYVSAASRQGQDSPWKKDGTSKNFCGLHHIRTVIKINKTPMVEIYKLAVRKCGESARARLALEKVGDLLQNKG